MKASRAAEAIAVVGWSCRVPGANSIAGLWDLLLRGQCAVSHIPTDRFALEHFGHPRKGERGRSYTWAAGVLDDIWGFDPAVFGISPREAQQMDPQQRILLQLAWEALEDAGIRPSSLAGTDVGVFVGGSVSENAHPMYGDPSVADSHFATGNALAILSNRISYVFDLHGPSITVDTACSSSLVAVHQAIQAIRSGRIETAIVGGINILTAPTSFISFAQATMLSPTGRCHAFSADADGYVRAEGGGILILRKLSHAKADLNQVHGMIVASDVNSDGRTNGISLPSRAAQESLLRRIYQQTELDPQRLAFVEAHGTGTPAGDPIEANAIGSVLTRGRSSPLPIGSIKTNIGHLEPASGLAGVIKSMLALNHGVLPASLHYTAPNPKIDFEALNLQVCREPMRIANADQQYAGVNSFGFGGTNAHVVVAPGLKTAETNGHPSARDPFFFFSGESKPALVALAQKYRERIADQSNDETTAIASAAAHRRDHLTNRLVITTTRQNEVAQALDAFLAGAGHALLSVGEAVGSNLPIAFIYTGNGSHWVGMGCAAYRNCAAFRSQFDEIDSYFTPLAGWSLQQAMFDVRLDQRLPYTNVAQPLIFAIQSAATHALRLRGLQPIAVTGHSVGEVAAAEAAGAVDLPTAVQLIHQRSTHQERVRKTGRMLAVLAEADTIKTLSAAVNGIEIAAYNGPRAMTVAGPSAAVAKFMQLAKQQGVVCLELNLDYPFHTELMAPIEAGLLKDLKSLAPQAGTVPFFSTVTGARLSGEKLDASYWWRNVREPVQFVSAVRAMAKFGAAVFLEIGPRGVLTKHISDALSGEIPHYVALSAFEQDEPADCDPINKIVARSLIAGAKIDIATIAGPAPAAAIALPSYPWQQKHFRFQATPEAIGWFTGAHHPLSGSRYDADTLEWHSFLDTAMFAELADHRLAEQTVLPGTGFIEIALSVASQWLPGKNITLTDFETLTPLDLTGDESREVLTRISSGSRTFEILSRQRLSQASWTLHVRGKIVASDKAPAVVQHPALPPHQSKQDSAFLYRIADATGLHYGPAFRQLASVAHHGDNLICVELDSQTSRRPFLLDPIRLDCCCQGLIMLFPELHAEQRGVAYIPVRVDSVTLHSPGAKPQRSIIQVLGKNERSIIGNFYIFDDADNVIATLTGVRCQAVPVRRTSALETVAFIESSIPADGTVLHRSGVAASLEQVFDRVSALNLSDPAPGHDSGSTQLMDGWAMMAAYEIAATLAENNIVDPGALIERQRVSEDLRSWLVMLMTKLTAARLAKKQALGWTLIPSRSLPSSASIIKELAAKYPERSGELLIAAEISGLARRLQTEPEFCLTAEACLSKISLDFYDIALPSVIETDKILLQLLQSPAQIWPSDRTLRVLQIGFGPLAQHLLRKHDARLTLTVLESDRRKFERAKASLANLENVRLINELDANSYDLILSANALHLMPIAPILGALRKALSPNGLLIALEPRPSFFTELVCGLRISAPTGHFDLAHKLPPSTKAWPVMLFAAGFEDLHAEEIKFGENRGILILIKARNEKISRQHASEKAHDIRIIPGMAGEAAPLADALRQHLVARQMKAEVRKINTVVPQSRDSTPNAIIQIVSADPNHDNIEALSQMCLAMKAGAESLGSATTTLWHIFPHSTAPRRQSMHPVRSGAWAFSRTLANEFQQLDVRRIELAENLSIGKAVEQIATIIESETPETELKIDANAIHVVRVKRLEHLQKGDGPAVAAARLERGVSSNQRLVWQPTARRIPTANEVEIDVAATGVNFRDLMYMLRLLPDDILEDGFTGPALGLECAGTVVAIGTSVSNVKVGDRVVTLAAHAFASHVTVPAAQVARIPTGMEFEAAATIPTAFITAYYSLVELAHLERDEWVLIHAGSGAVGMAAIKIAKLLGANVIATAGADAKRDLLRALGVEHVFDSRSTQFVEDVHKITGSGVDVVLNSLNGDAMERSVACLRPFGRFIELGKRDYVANTHIGLRPFRKNLSYFGVDIDQIMVSRPQLGRKVFAQVMGSFGNGALTPLPYSVFDFNAVSDAFHLMQKAGHIGKIIVRPPDLTSLRLPAKPFALDPNGSHLVTGGLGGLGLQTARWLADQGARHLVLVGRRGVASDEAKTLIADLSRRGVNVLAEACDVADETQLNALLDKMHRTMPRLVGIIHSAMVLDDAIIANLTAERIKRVFDPKAKGAENLDRLTRGLSLDYFVLYSSFVTLIGNRGQGSYVAANAYLEGLAQRRRAEGRPALAVRWGPISDVGIVARTEKMRTDLRRMQGLRGMRAQEALHLLGQALNETASDSSLAVITIAPHEAAFSGDLLPILRSPTYQNLLTAQDGSAQGSESKIDLRALLSTHDAASVRDKVIAIIVAQLARVLLLNKDDVSIARPLSEMGLDSLMALELIMSLEDICGVQLSATRAAGNMPSMPVTSFADEIIAAAGVEQSEQDNANAIKLVELHTVKVQPEQIAIMSKILQAEKEKTGAV